MLGAAVSQDGDEGLLVGAELLLSGLEEDLQGQIHSMFVTGKEGKQVVGYAVQEPIRSDG